MRPRHASENEADLCHNIDHILRTDSMHNIFTAMEKQ